MVDKARFTTFNRFLEGVVTRDKIPNKTVQFYSHPKCNRARADRIQTMVFDFDAKHGNIFEVHSTVQEVCCWTV